MASPTSTRVLLQFANPKSIQLSRPTQSYSISFDTEFGQIERDGRG